VAELLPVAFLGGLITGLSPCIVPVLPVVVAGGSTATNRSRPFLIIAGLVVSFSFTELVGSTVLSAIGLPQNFLFWFGIALLLLLAAGLLVPTIGHWIELPFNRLGASRYATTGGGFVLGLSLGLVFIPCAGPVLAAISVAAANHRIGVSSISVTLAYALGATIPLLVLALLAQRTTTGWRRLRPHVTGVRRVAGAVLAITTLAIAFGFLDPLQRAVPGYTSALEDHIEGGTSVSKQLRALDGEKANEYAQAAAKNKTAKKPAPATNMVTLPELGRAPDFTGIVKWLNTPGDQPLTLADLRGKVVLVDFWTYSCINCQRSLPHVEAWYNGYRSDGLVVVGVHTPEFAFEHVVSNVEAAAKSLKVDYPVAIDSNYGTWNAYGNEYWPAEYLIDPTGEVRAYDFGEGGYSTMESDIRSLLRGNGAQDLPSSTDVANKTPTQQLSPESYLGYGEMQYDVGTPVDPNQAAVYHAPNPLPSGSFAFNGTWTDHVEEATSGQDASIDLNFTADDVYLVMGGQGTVQVSFDGQPVTTLQVSGVPGLYTLFSHQSLQRGILTVAFSPGVQAYDFTFG
jgi:cytochrome c biogenesis protein CcdA/thiol-disulfide isomerase/thioredoxin